MPSRASELTSAPAIVFSMLTLRHNKNGYLQSSAMNSWPLVSFGGCC